MRVSTMIKTASTLAVVGTAAYMISQASPASKRKMKRSAGRAIHSFGNVCNDISRMM